VQYTIYIPNEINYEINHIDFNMMVLFLQAFASSITHSLATQALLKGVGVGDTSATVLAATITWLMKGMVLLARLLIVVFVDCC